jgi:hypothetical protein
VQTTKDQGRQRKRESVVFGKITNHIQCDEVHPACGNCSKHGVACDFGDPGALGPSQSRRQSSESSSVVKYSSPASPASGSSSSVVPFYHSPESTSTISTFTASSRGLEMRLLHNYTAMTSKTLASVNTAAMEQAWMFSVPDMAFETPCLMDAILAVSALHMRAQNPHDHSLVRASHGYMASALSQYSSALMSGVNASNAEALFSTSALIAFQASASRRFLEEDGEQGFGPNSYSLPVQWFHSFQGVKTVVLASWRWLRDSERVRPIIMGQAALALDMGSSRTAFFGPLLEGMDEQLESLDENKRAESRQAYEHAVAYLNWSHRKPERSRIMGFPATVSRRYVELLEQQDPRVLAITACFFAMTKAVDDVWWLQGTAKKEVTGIMSLLPKDWWVKMSWAIRVANHDAALDEVIWGGCWHTEGSPKVEEGFNGDVRSHIDLLAHLDPSMPVGTWEEEL